MFSGIVDAIGEVRAVSQNGDTRFEIAAPYAAETLDIGASVACAGVCLTIVEKTAEGFAVQTSRETLGITNAGDWEVGTRLNLERALKLGDTLDGHLVSGHVDGICEIVSVEPEGDSRHFIFRAPAEHMPFIARKGSVALDGTSLTVNEVTGRDFHVNLIPHSLAVTTWGDAQSGARVNLEIDMLARYVARLTEFDGK